MSDNESFYSSESEAPYYKTFIKIPNYPGYQIAFEHPDDTLPTIQRISTKKIATITDNGHYMNVSIDSKPVRVDRLVIMAFDKYDQLK